MSNVYRSKYNSRRFPIKHSTEEIIVLERFLKKEKPEIIVELGTYKGGLTRFFAETLKNCAIFSFDSIPLTQTEYVWLIEDLPKTSSLAIVTGDILNDENSIVFIKQSLLTRKEKTLLYCDNGNKLREISIYNNCLKPGDLLGIHDWGSEVDPEKARRILKNYEEIIEKEFEETKIRFFRKV